MVVLKVSLDIDMFNLLNRNKVIFALTAFLFICTLFTALAPQALAQPTSTDNSQSPPTNETVPKNEDGTTCAVEKVGWIVCPIVESAAFVGDKLFAFLADNFLQTEPQLISDNPGNGTKTAWELARNTANVIFIIVFIIVIYSQITSMGLSNYGIKRMMPRLIIIAIAMNLSFIICQLMVDLSNTLGYAIMDWLVGLSHTVFSQSVMPVQTPGTPNVTDVSLLGSIATAALAATAIWMLLGPLIGMVGLIVATCIAIIIILLLRKTFIILLVVVSPLAFVAYLLPNTEKLFSKWLSMFWKLLMVFPIVAMLMGGGQLASAIILASGQSASNYKEAAYRVEGEPCVVLDTSASQDVPCEDGQGPGIMLALVAAGVAVAPLLAVFAVMKGALAAAGAIGGKIAQGVQRGSGGLGKGAQGKFENTALARGMAARKVGKQQFKDNRYAQGVIGTDKSFRGRARKAMSGGITGALPQSLQTKSIQAQQSAVQRQAVNVASSNTNQQVKDSEAEMRLQTRGNIDHVAQLLENAIKSGNETAAKAAENILLGSGGKGVDTFEAVMSKDSVNANSTADVVRALKQHTLEQHGSIKEKSGTIANWAASGSTGGSTPAGQTMPNSIRSEAFSGLSYKQMATQTHESMYNAAATGALDETTAQEILKISSKEDIGGNQRAIIQHIADGHSLNTLDSRAIPSSRRQGPPTPPPTPNGP
ncbi:MAG: membrane protein of unknown function [Candidatus Saccharibacteria bacterium GW2011_GWC2_44_17]|nr:MAG: membrane protein of unknown function [Candidatus Saccharibacteria bacterium GW2011_GWC2_44_17]OGL23948.1 MAG: hypothetical protein A2791_03550 [Candidatus Saccharibacteria bacterium RIFCSPHIGHO2_01_FULL_46_30]